MVTLCKREVRNAGQHISLVNKRLTYFEECETISTDIQVMDHNMK